MLLKDLESGIIQILTSLLVVVVLTGSAALYL